MKLLLIAFGLTLLTSLFCIVEVLTNRFLSSEPIYTCMMLLIPAAIAALPMLFHRRKVVMAGAAYGAALLLFAWVAISGFSVGMFYLPATLMMAIAAVRMTIQLPAVR